jgi:Tfp pilus assembly protein PilF
LALAVIISALFGYSLLALGAFVFVRDVRGISQVHYLDLLLPNRWPKYRQTRGEHYLAEGRSRLLQGEYREAFALLGIGLKSAPADRDGRLALAQLHLDFRQPDLAEKYLEAGLPFHRQDPDYLRPYLGFLLQLQKDARVMALCRELLPLLPDSTARDRLLALAAATASYHRGNFDQAEDYIRIAQLQGHREGRLLAQKIDWERGYRDLALNDLRSLAIEFPDDGQVYAELSARLRTSDLSHEARRLSLAFSIAHPNNPRPRIELLRDYVDAGETARADHEVDALIRDFPTDSNALLALADFASNSANDALALRLYHHAQAHRLDTFPFALLAVEALVVARKHRPALELTKRLFEANPDWAKTHRPLFSSLQAITHFGLGDREAGELFLSHFNSHGQPRAENLLAIANRLLDVSAIEPALRLLARAIEADPLNQAALSRLITLELNHHRTDRLAAHLQRLLAMRRPSPDLLRVAHHRLGGDAFLFAPDRAPVLASIRAHLDADAARARRQP